MKGKRATGDVSNDSLAAFKVPFPRSAVSLVCVVLAGIDWIAHTPASPSLPPSISTSIHTSLPAYQPACLTSKCLLQALGSFFHRVILLRCLIVLV